jgi:hypothetical protein
MIIILTPTKDTYVTNLQTELNDGSLANTGHAATLDLFKLYNENKYSKSWAAFRFTGVLADSRTFIITDSSGITKTFEFDNNNNITAGNVKLDISGGNHDNYASIIAAAVNAEDTLSITAYSNSNNELILKQDKAGESGDTSFTLPIGTTNMSHIGGASITKFARIDYSAALLKFDISSFKTNYVDGVTFANSVYNDSAKFKAELVLKDVTTGLSKPRDYTLTAYPLLKDFDEGIGKDTIHFSDKDCSNFVSSSLASNGTYNTWEVPSYLSLQSDIRNADSSDTSIFEIGNEDIKFDVTSYIKKLIDDTGDNSDNISISDDKGFVVTFSNTYLYNMVTYFVKRTGSRHLLNKKFIPQLRIIIDDSSYHIPQNPKNKMRYLDNQEIFYLFNRVNGKLQSFPTPTANDTIELKIGNVLLNKTSSDVTNFKGQVLTGIKKVSITNSDMSRYSSNISAELLSSGSFKDTLEWYYVDDTNTNDENIVSGSRYKIKSGGDTDWISLGAISGNGNEVFTATKNGTDIPNGTGTVKLVNTILTEEVEFLSGETLKEINYRNVNTAIRIEDNDLIAEDNVQSVEVFFIDTFKQYDYVKVPYNLPSDNLGDVFYKITDIDTNDILIDYEETKNGTKMFFDGEKYIFDLFVPKIFKNRRVIFEFKFKDNITGANKKIKNKDKIFRIL